MKLKHKTKEMLIGYGFVAPWVVGFLIFTLIPLLRTFVLSLNKVVVTSSGIKTEFLAFQNYKDAFLLDVRFVDTLITYIGEMLISMPIIIVFAMIIALILNMDIKFKGIFRTIFFLPVIISSGPVLNELIEQGATSLVGIKKFSFIAQVTESLPGVFGNLVTYLISSFILILWFSGVQILIFLAGLQKMDSAIYEAASIDGASRWEAFWKITLPALKPMVVVNVVYTIITMSMFSLNKVIKIIQETSFEQKTGIGYASALAWIYFITLLIILGISVLGVTYKGKEKKHVI